MDEEQASKLREQTINKRESVKKENTLPESYGEAFLKVDGMHCSTCESFIETLADRQEGIYKSEASYASEMVKIYYDYDKYEPDELPPLLSKMGYVVREVDTESSKEEQDEIVRLLIGGFFGIIGLLLYILFLYPTYINGEGFVPLTKAEELFFVSNIFVMTSFVLFYTGFPILRGAWVSVLVLKPNMDLLITIAAVSAYLYSVGALLTGSAEVYFDVTMAIILVVSIGNYYEKKIKSGRQNLLSKLSDKKIKTARVRRNGDQEEVPISDIQPGEQIIVRAGERIPIDGTIINGEGVINETLMTGESIPVNKKAGDRVLSGTILTQNALTIKAGKKVQSTIDELLQLMWNIQSSRSGKQRLADRIATYFVPGVIILGIGTFAFHLFNEGGATKAMLSALAVLIVSCPCALGLATPLAISAGIRSALEEEIIFKTASVFEDRADAEIVAFDKTGTLTTGRMHLLDKGDNERALIYAALLERYSSHPIADPIARSKTELKTEVQSFRSYSTGVSGQINDISVYVGQPEWLKQNEFQISQNLSKKIKKSKAEGNIPVAVGWDGKVQSILVVGDQLRNETPKVLSTLKNEGKRIAIITGDSNESAQSLQDKLNPEFIFSEIRPESKSKIVKKLRNLGRVAMAGDGSNDAPALAEADLGIAFGDLTGIAAESAQVVIPNNRLQLVPSAFKAIRLTKNRIRQNLGWAFLYNIITIPLAITGAINPLFAAIAMATSSLLVVGNSSRKMDIQVS
jgi:Cu2+-exporting ATPase